MEGGFQLSVFSNQFSVKTTKYGIKVTKRAIGYDCSSCNLQFTIAQFAIKTCSQNMHKPQTKVPLVTRASNL